MLSAVILINKDIIDTVYVHNTAIMNKKGNHKYECWFKSDPKKIVNVWHKREDGWGPLVIKAIKAILR